MAVSTGAVMKNFLQVQKPLSSLWRHRGAAAVNCAVVRLQSNKSDSSDAGPTKTPAGKGASATPTPATDGKSYEVPEYYGYNEMSFYDYESEMLKYRQTQPDSRQPLQPAAAK